MEIKDGILFKENGEQVNVKENSIVEYVGREKWTMNTKKFIGKVVCHKTVAEECIGIYIEPMFIEGEGENKDWKKITDYVEPMTKYFDYPHLLVLPNKSSNGLEYLIFCHSIDANTKKMCHMWNC